MSQLKYTTQCIKESLRLYPPVPFVFKDVTEDTVIDGYYLVPKGSFYIYIERKYIDLCLCNGLYAFNRNLAANHP